MHEPENKTVLTPLREGRVKCHICVGTELPSKRSFGPVSPERCKKGQDQVVINNIVCSTEIFIATYHTSTGKALAFTLSSASSHLDSLTQHANSLNSSPALQRSLTYVAASMMTKALGLKSRVWAPRRVLGPVGPGRDLESPSGL
ncbi:PREDICTED: POPTR_0006s25460g [Prunus dulcis]|uniref:PREDICTED: POPTR_0006s25460g n=1 Tax=Prunus dulcis TaxID=3755 RepID=A0A5E4F7L9_PRUDU|nr:PREDICTED: POPTR_0006s25460g [Prunus dulcis]